MITFKEYLMEGINDRGIFKAIWVVGAPGAGKSYTVKKLSGGVMPRVVNTDKSAEHVSKKLNAPITSDNWNLFKDTTHKMTKESLAQYLNGMLPLFVDGTSNDTSNLLHRMGIVESLGYDVGLIYVSVPLDVALDRALKRAAEIKRHVDPEFIKQVHAEAESNVKFLRSRVSYFKRIENNGELSDEMMQDAYKATQSFFDAPVANPIGKRTLEKLKENKQKLLVPTIIDDELLRNKINGWYKY